MNTENNKLINKFLNYPYELNKIDSDWNQLIHVVEKIFSTCGEFEDESDKDMYWNLLTRNIRDAFYFPKINDVYNACIEFIKWYNQNKL